MPQFDTFSFFSQLFWTLSFFLLFFLSANYYLLPALTATLKIRKKVSSSYTLIEPNASVFNLNKNEKFASNINYIDKTDAVKLKQSSSFIDNNVIRANNINNQSSLFLRINFLKCFVLSF